MNLELQSRCDLLEKNYNLIHKSFPLFSSLMVMISASFFTSLNQEADCKKMLSCTQLLKKKEGIFSSFRGNVQLPFVSKMSLSDNPEEYYERIQSLLEEMKSIKWVNGEIRILSAMTLFDHVKKENYSLLIKKINVLYSEMKNNHPWLTNEADVPFAAMLSVSDLDTSLLTKRMEECYKALEKQPFEKDALQSLSHILSLNEEGTKEKCQQVIDLFSLLKEKKHKYGSGYSLSVLGTLTFLSLPTETIVEEIIQADDYLKKMKCFGFFSSFSDKTRRMYAALMVMDIHMPPAQLSHESALSATLALTVTMELCMMVVTVNICMTTTMISSSH